MGLSEDFLDMFTDSYAKRTHLLRSTMAGWDLTSSSLARGGARLQCVDVSAVRNFRVKKTLTEIKRLYVHTY